jgi:exodeoxyribonuclease VII small subunit
MTDQKLTFAKAYEELQQIIKESETNQIDLEKSISSYKRASELSVYLKKELQKMEKDIEEISLLSTDNS